MAGDIHKLNEKILKYEEFLNETLRSDLNRIVTCRDEVCKQISDYLQLRNIVESLQITDQIDKPMKTLMNLGSDFYVQAFVPDTSKICVNVGLGYYTELTADEALIFIERRVNSLKEISNKFTQESVKIKAHIRMVLEGLRELQLIDNEATS
uniref:Protein UXT n=1 Tax=Strigamia maritima TaxID=126957 RepID=T1JE96_STRMM